MADRLPIMSAYKFNLTRTISFQFDVIGSSFSFLNVLNVDFVKLHIDINESCVTLVIRRNSENLNATTQKKEKQRV